LRACSASIEAFTKSRRNIGRRITGPRTTRPTAISEALKSFRNHGAFHEDCTVAIGKKLVGLLKPKWLRIGGYWYPRGGMPIDVFWQAGKLPAGVWVPDPGVAPYRGRG
jgi:NADPH-dependent 7-cyano-7-deazaguanine reductase QueF